MSTTHSGKTQVAMLKSIDANIDKLKASEKITKSTLGTLSRQCLTYLVLNGATDIGVVNRLMDVCTPMNRKASQLYFNEFLPWSYDKDKEQFGGMIKGKKAQEKYNTKVKEFLDDPKHNIWTWAKDNIQMEKPPVAFEHRIDALIKKALEGETNPDGSVKLEAISSATIIKTMITAGVAIDEVLTIMDEVEASAPEATEEEVSTPVH